MKKLSEEISNLALRAHHLGRNLNGAGPTELEAIASELHVCADTLHTHARSVVSTVPESSGE